MKVKQIVVLTGFMGSGKSAIGKRLAKEIGWPFHDLDDEIEKGEKRPIAQIFRDDGEAAFRKLELIYVEKLLQNPPFVLALGGGAIRQPGIMSLMKENGKVIYLKVPEETLFKRLTNDKKRPLLKSPEGGVLQGSLLRKRIRQLLLERKNDYEQADLTLNVQSHWSKEETTEQIIQLLSKNES